MRRDAVPGAFGSHYGSRQVEPASTPRKRRQSPSDERRKARRVEAQRVETVEQIQVTAHERHEAWVEGEHQNVVERTTRELDGLFVDRRGEQVGTLRDPYYGTTMGLSK